MASCKRVSPLQTKKKRKKKKKKKKVPFASNLSALRVQKASGLGWSRLGAALAVRVRPGGAGVQVRVVLVVLVLRQALLSYPPVGGAEASQQALVVEATALFTKGVLVVRVAGSGGGWETQEHNACHVLLQKQNSPIRYHN